MKKDIHPKYYPEAKVVCACGNTWTTGSTQPEIRTEMCSACHPFFTGEQRIVDTAGQVERFERRKEIADQLKEVMAQRAADKQERGESIFEFVAEDEKAAEEGAVLTKLQAAAVAEAMLEPEVPESPVTEVRTASGPKRRQERRARRPRQESRRRAGPPSGEAGKPEAELPTQAAAAESSADEATETAAAQPGEAPQDASD